MLITLKTFIKQQGSIPFWKHYSCFSEKMLSKFSQLQIFFHLVALLLYVCSWLRFSKRSRTNLSCPCPSALLWSHFWWKPCPFHSQLVSPSGLTCPSVIVPRAREALELRKTVRARKQHNSGSDDWQLTWGLCARKTRGSSWDLGTENTWSI